MRYDKPIFFQTVTAGEYDDSTGDYGDEIVTEVKRLASVIDTDDERKQLVYGNVKQVSKTISLLNIYSGYFDRIRVDDVLYQVDMRSTHRRKQTFVVSEIAGRRWAK